MAIFNSYVKLPEGTPQMDMELYQTPLPISKMDDVRHPNWSSANHDLQDLHTTYLRWFTADSQVVDYT